MLIGFYQFKPEFGNVEGNLSKIEDALADCKADVLVLPELCTTGYQFVSRDELASLAEEIPGGFACGRLSALSGKTGIAIIAGIAEKSGKDLFNSSAFFTPSGEISKYRKIHLFFEETLYFTPGDKPPEVIDIGAAKIGMLICFDWVFPEVFRILALKGADIVVQPANLVLPYCQDAMKTRSIENRIFTVTANRTGREERGGKEFLQFTGKSQVTDERGNVLVSVGEDEETLKIVEIDPVKARDKELNRYNSLLKNRKPELYKELVK